MKRTKKKKVRGELLFFSTFRFLPSIFRYSCCCIQNAEDNDHLCEELKDLIDDNPIDEGSELDDSDNSIKSQKRKNHDDEYLDDRLEDDDYDLIEENLGVKVERTVSGEHLLYRLHLFEQLMCSYRYIAYIVYIADKIETI